MNWLAFMWKTPERRITTALLLFLSIIFIPFAGNYGLWDPWETHYAEVARQMLARHDFVSLWWPGSPQDRNEFWSKPVLSFWLMAISFGVAGLERVGHAFDGEMATAWTAEWAARMPFILCGIACVWAVWELTRRLAGRRAALWAAIVLATSTQFFLVTRQAMTDMAFVAPIAVALCFAGLGLILPEAEVGVELERRSRKLGPLSVSWPHAPIFYLGLGMSVLMLVPQAIIMSVQVQLAVPVGKHMLRMIGLVPMLPWIAAGVGYFILALRARTKRQIYFQIAFLMCGISTLAKGPAGIALPVLVILGYLLVQGEMRRMLPPPPSDGNVRKGVGAWFAYAWRFIAKNPLELAAGVLLFIAVTFPWYHAMLIRHGMGFWNEFIGDNYVHRAAGRHGDRGIFDYYFLQLAHGMFPWTAVVAAACLGAVRRLVVKAGSSANERDKLRGFAFAWFLIIFAIMSLVNTKFHHYILPAFPGLAILAGLYLDDLFTKAERADLAGLLLVGVPLLALAARDLAMYPARLLWLFCYDYVNAPGGGRPWPAGADYDYKFDIAIWGVVAVLATVALGVALLWRQRRVQEEGNADVSATWLGGQGIAFLALLLVVTVALCALWQPAAMNGPQPLAYGWILVGVASVVALFVIIGPGLFEQATRRPTMLLFVVAAVACLWTGWTLDRFITDVSPHWSQKHIVASYYRLRSSADEPLIAWQMYWRGETFYSKNAIYDHHMDQNDKTVFLGDHNAEKMQKYFATHAGRRMFFIVERSRFEALRGLLPEAARASLRPEDETNNKVYLASAQL